LYDALIICCVARIVAAPDWIDEKTEVRKTLIKKEYKGYKRPNYMTKVPRASKII
jgi:hypothetical protein